MKIPPAPVIPLELVIAWDGEGINVKDHHRYVLLAAGNAAGIITDRVSDLRGISLERGLDALARGLARPGIHVGYATTYDVTMLFRRLPRPLLERLYTGKPLEWGTRAAWYRVEWRRRRFLKVYTRAGSLEWTGGTLWDIWSYTQAPLLDACIQYGVGTARELEHVRRGKLERARFTDAHLERITDYNAVELKLTAGIAVKIIGAMRAAKLRVNRWDGPGPAAAALLVRGGNADRRAGNPPAGVERASRHAYYGGRSEVIHYGHKRAPRGGSPVIEYDITSAYPSVLAGVPCTARGCGHWKYFSGDDVAIPTDNPYALHRIRWHADAGTLHPFPWRAPNGGVYFPPRGEGWVWTPELAAGAATHELELVESWQWQSECRHETAPFAWVRDVWHERERMINAGDTGERALKIALNTLYGKFAQRAGTVRLNKGGWKRPRWYDLCLAGYLTSAIRARIYAAAAPIAGDVLLIATDSLITRAPAPHIKVSDRPALGAWTRKEYTGATIVQSGLYWLHRAGGVSDAHTRGIDTGTLDWRDVVRGWRELETHVDAPATRFASIAEAQARGRGWRELGQWRHETRQIALHPWGTKRAPVVDERSRRPIVRPDRGFCPTLPTPIERYGSSMATPIGVPWAKESADPDLAR